MISNVLSRLKSVKETANGWQACCPAHDDQKASLSIAVGEDGKILLRCHADCPVDNVLGAIGLKRSDLFPARTNEVTTVKRRIVATYDYVDEVGSLLFQCVRFDPKDFRQRRPDPLKLGEFIWNLKGVRLVLYRFPELKAAIAKGQTIYIAEGEKDCNALGAAGFDATCNPMGAGKWRHDYTEILKGAANVVVIADKDTPGRNHAQGVAMALHGVANSVKLIELPDRDGKQVKDVADFFDAGGTADELSEIVEAGPKFLPSPKRASIKSNSEYLDEDKNGDETIARLANLPPVDYNNAKEETAKRLGCPVWILDKLVTSIRSKNSGSGMQGSKVTFPDLEPWPELVNGAALLNEIAVTLGRFVVAPEPAIIAASLFTLHTYAFDFGEISPILFITGPTKRCGKSKFLAILLRLVSKPFATSSATPAGIYRIIELHHPTLCIDEVDAFMRGDEQLRGLINSGHTRDAAFHLGCTVTGNKDYEPRRWSTWTPKIFSGIGRLADTIEDRAIIIKMVRRRKDESCERLHHGTRFEDIPRKALRFVSDHANVIRNANPSLPEALNDRAADNWTPLLILADLAGGDWPAKARQAALALSGANDGESLGTSGQLLVDIRDIFDTTGAEKLFSEDIAKRLAQIEGRPWSEYGKQSRPISANQLANLLRGFGVSSKSIRIGKDTGKGYIMAHFLDAFSRYLPGSVVPKGNNVTSPVNIGESGDLQKVTVEGCDVSENGVSTNADADCDVVTFEKPKKELEVDLF